MAVNGPFLKVPATLTAVPNAPSVHAPLPMVEPFGKALPEPRGLEPVQLKSPIAKLSLFIDEFWPGETIALHWNPLMIGDSYQMACGRRASNSARMSPPVLPICYYSHRWYCASDRTASSLFCMECHSCQS